MPISPDEFDSGVSDDKWARAWEPGINNNIIIFDKPVPLVKQGSKSKLVRNYKDDPKLDFIKRGTAKGLPMPVVRPRKGYTMDDMDWLKEAITYVVLHTDLTSHANKTFDILLGRGLSTHICINWNGIIYQYTDLAYRAAHAANHNEKSIGIDLNHRLINESNPSKRAKSRNFTEMRRGYTTRLKQELIALGFRGDALKLEMEKYEWEKPASARIQFGSQRTWGYTRKQYNSLILLLKLFVRLFDLEKSYPRSGDGKVIPQELSPDDQAKITGFIAHYHISSDRWDPGPNFNWERVLAGIQNEYNWFPLAWDAEMVLQGKEPEAAQRVAYKLMRNTEKAAQGGTYPIGPNQTWHGGVHIFPPQESGRRKKHAVHAMFDGVVAAAHFEPYMRELGHNNFVLLKHEMELPVPNASPNEDGSTPMQKYPFFSLYMHLEPMDVSKAGATKLTEKYERFSWITRMYAKVDAQAAAARGTEDAAVDELMAQYEKQREELQARIDAGMNVDDDLADLILDVDEEIEEGERPEKPPLFLKPGFGADALQKEDRVAILVNDDFQIAVNSGEVLGFTGLLPDIEEPERYVPAVHVEIFGGEELYQAIDLDAYSKYFRTPQRARKSDLTVRTEDMLTIFREAEREKLWRRVQIWPETKISPDDIINFYGHPVRGKTDRDEVYREQLRRSITYHVSEWSDKVDWIASLTGGNDWATAIKMPEFEDYVRNKGLFSAEVRKFIPFIWLTDEVAEAIGLTEESFDGRVYHFHPIHFVMWMTFYAVRRTRTYRTSVSLARLYRQRAQERAIQKLIERGRKAVERSPNSYTQFREKTLPRLLGKAPFYLTRRARRRDKQKEERYVELTAQIIAGAEGRLEQESEDDEVHGIVEAEPVLYGNPKEVLQDLVEMKGQNEWRIKGYGESI